MNPDTLERLLIDRDGGELPADTLELLSAYLQANPEAAREARQIEDTLQLAKQALSPHRQPALPPRSFKPELRLLERDEKAAERSLRWPLAIAACFACGLFVGSFWLRPAAPSPVVVEKRIVVAQAAVSPPAQTSGFWSANRLYRAELSAPRSTSSGLIWESPVKKPQLKSSL